MNIDKVLVATRKKTLEEVSKQLKTEFFGLDLIIDKVIDAVYAWYVFPELIRRPVIVNLWGQTGVGKTQLVRRLAALIGFSKKFVEIQMDGTSGGSTFNKDSICSILSNCINEGEAGILLLDEIQRFRTISVAGEDVKVERFQDVWMLLSDGKFAANSDLFIELEMMAANQLCVNENKKLENRKLNKQEKDSSADIEVNPEYISKFKIWPYEARMIKRMLRLAEPITEIMTWSAEQVEHILREIRNTRIDWQIDYSKLLIFVSGNLDSAFIGSKDAEDCDTDADYYHKLTSHLTAIDIKKALGQQFKPEQISRLGSNHIIYPSMSKKSYQQLIKATCNKYVSEMTEVTDIKFVIDDQVYSAIYDNAVYPTQGTRPVFSAIHKIFGTGLVNIACYCLEQHIEGVSLIIDIVKQKMVATELMSWKKFEANIELEISNRKSKISKDMKALIAVHETGHALIYALLRNTAPFETKINAISFSNGYMVPADDLNQNQVTSRQSLRDSIAMLLAGMVAEEIIFGMDNRSSGCAIDIVNATSQAGYYIRRYGYDYSVALVDAQRSSEPTVWNSDLEVSNASIEALMQVEKERAKKLIENNFALYKKLVDNLLEVNVLSQQEFVSLAKEYITLGTDAQSAPYFELYKNFALERTGPTAHHARADGGLVESMIGPIRIEPRIPIL